MNLENSMKLARKYRFSFIDEPEVLYGEYVPLITPDVANKIERYKKVGVASHKGIKMHIIEVDRESLYVVPDIEIEDDFLWHTAFPPTTYVKDDKGLELMSNDIIATEDGGYIISSDWQYEKDYLDTLSKKTFIGTLRRSAPNQWIEYDY